jgi:hypothetical protein
MPVYAIVTFDQSRQVAEVIVAFESALAADGYAQEAGVADYTVGPIGFVVSEVPEVPRWHGPRVL